MWNTHATGRRLAALTGLCLALMLVAATNALAYPAMPEGDEPVRSDTLSTPSAVVDGSSGGIDWIAVAAVIAGLGLTALALVAATLLTGRRRKPKPITAH